MFSSLPININDLLHFQGVESARIELKQSWDEKTTEVQVLKTLCAFANDFYRVVLEWVNAKKIVELMYLESKASALGILSKF